MTDPAPKPNPIAQDLGQVELISRKDALRVYDTIRQIPGPCLLEIRVFPKAPNGELLTPVLTINRTF